MNEMMTFPDTWEEFEKSYGFTDNEEVYTNGARLIPSFRAKQWLDHLSSEEPQKWIPVSERLPEDYIRVLTTNSKIGVWEVDINSRNVAGWIYSSDPVAWMPLPDPWKEAKE